MEYFSSFLLLLFLWLCSRLLLQLMRSRRSKLPPGPRPLPLIGNLLEVGSELHQILARLAKVHGPVMTLRLGAVTVVVISSRDAAKEALQKNDQALSNRVVPDSMRSRDHHRHSVVWLPATAKWKGLRKVCSVQVFSRHKLDATEPLRRKKADELLDYLRSRSAKRRVVDIGQAAFTTVLNMISRTIFSVDIVDYNKTSGQEFKEIVWGIMEAGGAPNISDFFPALRILDLQRARRRTTEYFDRLFVIFDRLILERVRVRQSSMGSAPCNDVLDSLLDLEDRSDFSRKDINSLLVDLFVAGVDTSQDTIEWAMAELLRNPDKIAKARAELRQVIGDGVAVKESGIPRLPYLQAVVKETFRLHPPTPLLLPHKVETPVSISGFELPKNIQVMVNVWAISRDPTLWPNPTRFEPERFLGIEIDYKGTDFELIPFGAGRRICPGLPLGHRVVHLILGSLIHSFDWKLASETPETIDMSEKLGFTLQKAKPLHAIPV